VRWLERPHGSQMQRLNSYAAMAVLAISAISTPAARAEANEPDGAALKPVLEETARFWTQQFAQLGGRYQVPALTLFSAPASGLCGQKGLLAGSFYCPADQHLYIDPSSLNAIGERARDDRAVATAFVMAHVVAHHVQYLIGTTAAVQQARSTSTPENANRTLVTMELQADCYAGLYLHAAVQHKVLVVAPTALSAALAAVAAESKLRAGAMAAGTVVPDPMDTGTAAQRLRWTQRGFESGNFEDCDTFGAAGKGEL
jgi:uncharacterized protein